MSITNVKFNNACLLITCNDEKEIDLLEHSAESAGLICVIVGGEKIILSSPDVADLTSWNESEQYKKFISNLEKIWPNLAKYIEITNANELALEAMRISSPFVNLFISPELTFFAHSVYSSNSIDWVDAQGNKFKLCLATIGSPIGFAQPETGKADGVSL